jgi:hypothetical protein
MKCGRGLQNIIRFVEDKYRGGENMHDSLLRLFFSIPSPAASFAFNRSSSFISGFETDGTLALKRKECRGNFYGEQFVPRVFFNFVKPVQLILLDCMLPYHISLSFLLIKQRQFVN